VLKALLNYAGVTANPREVKLFVASRNALVHEGKFYVEAAKPEQRRRLPPLADALSEYFFLVSFLDRFMMKLFGYSGAYVDWAKYPAHEQGVLP
jgi:hypothetical protein